MDNPAARSQPVSFHTPFLAGRTSQEKGGSDWIHRPTGMDAWILNCTVHGEGRVNRGPDMFFCRPGDLLLFPPRVAHDYEMSRRASRWVHLWVYFFPRASWAPLLGWPQVSGGVLRLDIGNRPVRGHIEERLSEIAGLCRRRLPYWYALCMNYLEEILLLSNRTVGRETGMPLDERIETAIAYVHANVRSVEKVNELARRTGLSLSRFSHLFTEQVGVAPARYLQDYRIGLAQELLVGTSRPIASVAHDVGFEDALYFSRVFRRSVGKSPRQFRREAW